MEESNPRIWKQENRWLVTSQFLEHNTPSRLVGIPYEQENEWLQQLCQLIQDLGQKIEVTQLCINTACVYLRRVFCFTDLKRFNRHQPLLQVVAATCLFLAAKVEEKPRKLEHMIMQKMRLCGSHIIGVRFHGNTQHDRELAEINSSTDDYKRMESAILKILGFDLTIDHPHTHVVKACQSFNASADFAQTAYFMATNVLQLTNLCLMYNPATVAGVCIFLAFKWSRYQMFPSREGLEWYKYVEPELTLEKLEDITRKLMATFAKHPEMVQRFLQPQKSQTEPDRKRRRLVGFFGSNMNSEGSSSGTSSSSSAARPQQPPGPSSLSASQPGSSRSHSNADPHRHQRAAMQHHPGIKLQSGHPHMQKASNHHAVKTEGVIVTSSVTGSTSGVAMTAVSRSSTQSTTVHHPGVSSSAKGQSSLSRPMVDQRGKPIPAPLGSQPVAGQERGTKKLSLHDYQQRAEQRPAPPPPAPKAEPLSAFPMHPSGKPLHPSGKPLPPKPAHHNYPHPHPQQKKSGKESERHNSGRSESQSQGVVLKEEHQRHGLDGQRHSQGQDSTHRQPQDPHNRQSMSEDPSHRQSLSQDPHRQNADSQSRSQSHELSRLSQSQDSQRQSQDAHRQSRENLKQSHRQSRETHAQATHGKETRQHGGSPVKMFKKEGVFSAMPDNVHLKEAKVMVHDLKDAQGQEKVLYNHAEASRKRSFSQSQEDDGESARHSLSSRQSESQRKHSRHHDSRKILQAGRHSSSRTEVPESVGEVTPIKLHIQRASGKLHIKNSDDSSTPPSTNSSPLKVKIKMNPDASVSSPAIVSNPVKQAEEGLKLRLPIPASARSHDKRAESHDRRHKHSGHAVQANQQAYHQSRGKQMHRSSSVTQMVMPSLSGDGSGHMHKSHSRPMLQTQHSGFSFPEQLITPNLPDNIFEPETPTDINGGFGAPETPTPENMNRVSAHMQQLYAQSAGQQMSAYSHFPHDIMNNVAMYPTQPPLPPPLPSNPPPPPPPPPQ